MTHSPNLLSRILLFSLILAFLVVAMGAYTRLSDAGLGCPDWPGCYGHISVPEQVSQAQYQRPLESGKAWKEMIHRYIAGTLGLLILAIFLISAKNTFSTTKKTSKQSLTLPTVLLIVVIFQALLGMWTVTMLLSPIIVSAHLIGGLTTLALLWWIYLNNTQNSSYLDVLKSASPALKPIASIGLILVSLQIFLGGWTSTNYAALACGTSFPTCATEWWPAMDFSSAFNFSHAANTNYEFGILESSARTAIQVTHRIGALILSIYLVFLGVILLKQNNKATRNIAITLFVVLALQITLGILNVVLALPLLIAVLHNVMAAFLLLTLITINYHVHQKT